MIEFICMMLPSFISIYILTNIINKKNKKYKVINLICYYAVYCLINNLFMHIIIKYFFGYEEYVFTTSFAIKYILLSSIIAVILPLVNTLVENFIKTPKNEKRNYIKTIYEDHKEQILGLSFIIVFVLANMILVTFISNYCNSLNLFTRPYTTCTRFLNFFYALLFAYIVCNMPKKLSKIVYLLICILNILLVIANYLLLNIKDSALSIYDLNNAGEGMRYLNFTIKFFNAKFILILVIATIIYIVGYLILRKADSQKNAIEKIISIILIFLIFSFGRSEAYHKLETYEADTWGESSFPRYYADNFINSKKSLTVLGLYEYHVKDIKNYIQENTSKPLSDSEMRKIIKSRKITLEKNDYTGLLKGKNVIMILLESVDNILLTKENMPYLSSIREKGINFTNRYGYSIATNFVENTSLSGYYMTGKAQNKNHYYNSLPFMLKKSGYLISSIHQNEAQYYNRDAQHLNLGFDRTFFLADKYKNNFDYTDDIQLSSNPEFYNYIINKDNNSSKFMTYIITLRTHGPYVNTNQCQNITQSECVKNLTNNTDTFVKTLIENLERDNLLNDTVLVFFDDHYSYSYEYSEGELEQYYGESIGTNYDLKNIPFFIYNPNIEAKSIDTLVNDIDMVPTLLNLLGIEYDPNVYPGTDVFASYHPNLIMLPDGRWYDGKTYSQDTDIDMKSDINISNSKKTKEIIEFNNQLVDYIEKDNSIFEPKAKKEKAKSNN